MNDVRVSDLLSQLRAMGQAAQGAPTPPAAAGVEQGPDFVSMLRHAVDEVNSQQQSATKLAEAFESGDKRVDIAEVMVSLQKASIGFQAMTQVRNKLVSAYQDIMGMQV